MGLTRSIGTTFRRLRHSGAARYCPACGSRTAHFSTYGSPPRPDAKCPVCSSSERERAQVLLLERNVFPRISLRTAPRALHIAPERGVERALRRIFGSGYVSGDFEAGRAMTTLDLTALPYADESFDFMFVSHVLEHIPDDRRAMAEIHRVLTSAGAVFVEVPVLCKETYEDPAVATAEDRKKEFGQNDHVRLCGLDYQSRLERAGFEVEALWVEEQFSGEEIGRMRLRIELPLEIKQAMPARYEQHFNVSWLCRKPKPA